jgi:hypothetical protein
MSDQEVVIKKKRQRYDQQFKLDAVKLVIEGNRPWCTYARSICTRPARAYRIYRTPAQFELINNIS